MGDVKNVNNSKAGFTSKFRTKFIMVAVGSVLIGLVLSSAVAIINLRSLGKNASDRVERGLSDASREYLENYIKTTAVRTNLMLERAFDELNIFGNIMQDLLDHPKSAVEMGRKIAKLPLFHNKLVYNPDGNWYQTAPKSPVVVSVWGYLLDKKGRIRSDVKKQLKDTAILDLLLPSFKINGPDKLYMYMVGPPGMSYLRLSPYVDMATKFDKLYPGHNAVDFWTFFFPGLVDSWQSIADSHPDKKKLRNIITITSPYEDAAGGGIIVSCFHPLWSDNYSKFAGAAGLDLSLRQIVNMIKDVKLAKTGFAFFAKSQGDVLAVNAAGEKILGLSSKTKNGAGVSVLDRNLRQSPSPDIANLKLPVDDKVHIQRVNILKNSGGGKFKTGEQYIVVTKQMTPVLTYINEKVGIKPQHWILGFVVPESEIYSALIATRKSIAGSVQNTLMSQIGIALFTLFVVLLGVLLVAKHMTAGLISLAKAAETLQKKDYKVRVNIISHDEIGQLGYAFNSMAGEIQKYTENLEQLVKDRTKELEDANREISELNSILKAENVRLGAEMAIAQRIQLMVLPKKEELELVPGLDIAGHMSPADEVGGDYYDVLQFAGHVKIGMGDVTGHGLESGVIMLMVQSITRTLLDSGEYNPVRFLTVLNSTLFKNIERINSDKNLTLSFIDYVDGKLTLSGQHEEVIVVRKDGTVELIDTMDLGFPIGLEENIEPFVATQNIPVESGDIVTLFTDGITEADNLDNEQYGIERLCNSIVARRSESADQIKNGVVEDLMNYIGDQVIHDDITLVVIKAL